MQSNNDLSPVPGIGQLATGERQTRQVNHPSYSKLLETFRQPPLDYSDFVTWFWETGNLDKERITWQLEELKKKGVGGTWYYPRYLDGERYGTWPAYFSEAWWAFFRHSVAEHERLGLEAWFSGWEGREYWQDLLRAERAARPELEGRRLVIHETRSQGEGTLHLDLPQGETVLAAAAFRIEDGGLDPDSCRELALPEPGQPLAWDAPGPGWLLAAIASQPHDLDYLNPHVAARYLEIYWQEHEERLREFVPGTLSLYGQDELYVLNGNILYAPALVERFKAEKGYDPASLHCPAGSSMPAWSFAGLAMQTGWSASSTTSAASPTGSAVTTTR